MDHTNNNELELEETVREGSANTSLNDDISNQDKNIETPSESTTECILSQSSKKEEERTLHTDEKDGMDKERELHTNSQEDSIHIETPSESTAECLLSQSAEQEGDRTINTDEKESMHKERELHTNSQEDSIHIETPKKEPFTKRNKTPLLLFSCLLLGGVGGFGGSYLASKTGTNTNGNVVLQTVDRSDQDGNSISNLSVKDVVANTANSVVEITTESATNDDFLQQYVTKGAGSGVIISQDGYIVTNNHVIDGASKVTVRTKTGEEYNAVLIGRDEKTDLAVIKIEASGLNAVVMGNSADIAVGETAIAIGNPLGQLGGTVTEGIISALDREITIDGQSMTLLQTDTAINSGNSGGGLFNTTGELIGIVNAKSSGSSVEGLGFAIPIDTAKPVIQALIENGYVTGRPQLGVSIIDITNETSAFQSGVNELGVYIAKVNSGSAAEEAGLQVRDRVLRVDGEEITTSSQITKFVDSKQVGDTITIIISRNGEEKTIKATLKEAQQILDATPQQQKQSTPFMQ